MIRFESERRQLERPVWHVGKTMNEYSMSHDIRAFAQYSNYYWWRNPREWCVRIKRIVDRLLLQVHRGQESNVHNEEEKLSADSKFQLDADGDDDQRPADKYWRYFCQLMEWWKFQVQKDIVIRGWHLQPISMWYCLCYYHIHGYTLQYEKTCDASKIRSSSQRCSLFAMYAKQYRPEKKPGSNAKD